MARASPRFAHPAREFGRERSATSGPRPTRASFSMAISRATGFRHGAQQAKGDIAPDRQAVKQRRVLEEHAEAVHEFGPRIGKRRTPPQDFAGIRHLQPQDTAQQHRFPGARAADHGKAFAAGQVQVDPVQHPLGPEGLAETAHAQHQKNSPVSAKFAARMPTEAATTAFVVARPRPPAPPRASRTSSPTAPRSE